MPIIQLDNGELQWYWPEKKATVSQCFTQKKIFTVLDQVLEAGLPYDAAELIMLVNESEAGRRLHPKFKGKRAKDMIDKLAKRGKLTQPADGFYTLKPRGE